MPRLRCRSLLTNGPIIVFAKAQVDRYALCMTEFVRVRVFLQAARLVVRACVDDYTVVLEFKNYLVKALEQ